MINITQIKKKLFGILSIIKMFKGVLRSEFENYSFIHYGYFPFPPQNKFWYSHIPHYISVNDRLHIWQWSHKVIIPFFNCVEFSCTYWNYLRIIWRLLIQLSQTIGMKWTSRRPVVTVLEAVVTQTACQVTLADSKGACFGKEEKWKSRMAGEKNMKDRRHRSQEARVF